MCVRKTTVYVVFFLFISLCFATNTKDLTDVQKVQLGKKKMSEYVLQVLEHYKQKDPVGIPGTPIMDPMQIPPLEQSFSIGKMHMKNINVYGLSKFRIHHIKTNLAAMEVEAALTIDALLVLGNYTLKAFLSNSQGPFTVNLKNVYAQAIARMEVQRNGTLEAQDINMDITVKNIDMKFENLPLMAKMVESFINSLGSFIFESIKPYILGEVNSNIRQAVNEQARKIPQTFPNSISPFDQLVAEARKKVRAKGYDPYRLQDYNNTAGVATIQLTHTWITGLSSFYRVGDITFEVKNHTIRADVLVGTQRLKGSSHWDASLVGGLMSRAGTIQFSVEHLKVQLVLSQSLDTRNRPQIEDIQLELGNIQVRSDGAGTADYVIEMAINVIPNLLRYQIMDALESPLKKRIQAELNTIDVEKVINDNIEKLDNLQDAGLENFLS